MATMTTADRPSTGKSCAGDVEELNSLLRGELAALETYQKALPKFDEWYAIEILSRISDEHAKSAALLRDRIRSYGGVPATSSGVWGASVVAATGAAKFFGPQTVLVTLLEGE